jgi:lipoate-protein ligase A
MAVDETLLRSAAAGVASLRFYGWATATLSLGYFQPERLRRQDERLAALPFVRRPSGGDALVHHHEITYCLALPAERRWYTARPWACRMHEVVARALAGMGVASAQSCEEKPKPFTGVLCFQHQTPGDLLVRGEKVVGSAQRRQRGALMQHGAVLLTASPYTPLLPGVQDLTEKAVPKDALRQAVVEEFARETGCQIESGDWSDRERTEIAERAESRYANDRWNCKR